MKSLTYLRFKNCRALESGILIFDLGPLASLIFREFRLPRVTWVPSGVLQQGGLNLNS